MQPAQEVARVAALKWLAWSGFVARHPRPGDPPSRRARRRLRCSAPRATPRQATASSLGVALFAPRASADVAFRAQERVVVRPRATTSRAHGLADAAQRADGDRRRVRLVQRGVESPVTTRPVNATLAALRSHPVLADSVRVIDASIPGRFRLLGIGASGTSTQSSGTPHAAYMSSLRSRMIGGQVHLEHHVRQREGIDHEGAGEGPRGFEVDQLVGLGCAYPAAPGIAFLEVRRAVRLRSACHASWRCPGPSRSRRTDGCS